MALEGKLVERNNKLYIVIEDAAQDEPILRQLFYPVVYNGTAQNFKRNFSGKIGQVVWYDNIREAYRDIHGMVYDLPDGGKTLAEFMEESSIPRPKVRSGIEVRYKYGHWEKCLKSRGWVPV